MSLGDIHIMMFYGRPENINLTHSIKFITITLLKYSFSEPTRKKTIEFTQCLRNFGETSQGRPNCVLKRRLHSDVHRTSILNIIQSTLLLYYLRSYSPIVLRETLKSYLLLILKVLEKRSADILKTSRKGVRRVTSLGRTQDVNFELLVQMNFHCIIFNFISANACLKH